MPVLIVDRVNRRPTENAPGIANILPPPPTEFEAAEVKPSGRVELVAWPLRELIAVSWNVEPSMVVSGQKWIEAERFDVIATGIRSGSSEAIRKMMQSLLIDRFRVTVHREDQPVPVFALEQAKRGFKFKQARGDGFPDAK